MAPYGKCPPFTQVGTIALIRRVGYSSLRSVSTPTYAKRALGRLSVPRAPGSLRRREPGVYRVGEQATQVFADEAGPEVAPRLFAGDVTDLYETHEVAAFLAEDAQRLREYVAPASRAKSHGLSHGRSRKQRRA